MYCNTNVLFIYIFFFIYGNYFIFQSIDSSKDESSVRTESKPIAAQTQPTNNPEIVQV